MESNTIEREFDEAVAEYGRATGKAEMTWGDVLAAPVGVGLRFLRPWGLIQRHTVTRVLDLRETSRAVLS